MIDLILQNLTNVGIGVGLLILAWCSNVVLSLYYNTKVLDEVFDLTRLKNGLYKLIAVLLGVAMLVVLITTIPIYLEHVGMVIPEEYIELVTMTSIIATIGFAIIKYTVDAIKTLKDIFNPPQSE